MRACALLAVVVFTATFAPAVHAALATLPAGADAREAQLVSRLSPQARAWIRQEAKREAASNSISDAAATQAVRASGIDLAGMPIEDAVMLVMMQIQRDADADLRQSIADMQKANAQKKAMREQASAQKNAQASASAQLHKEYAAQSTAQSPPPATAATRMGPRQGDLDAYLDQQRIAGDSLSDISSEQQMRMQMLMDQRSKAIETLSNIMKKSSDTSKSIIQNMK